MTHTLFIDESGSFDSNLARWVVSGILVPGHPVEAEQAVCRVLEPTLAAHVEQVRDPASLHLTEFRSSPGRAHRVADAVLRSLVEIPGARAGAVRNRLKGSVGGRSGPVDTFERAYRLMLLDLLALLEASLPAEQHVSELHLVIATRTAQADGGQWERMTTLGELRDDVLGHLAEAVEAGLAARGLLESTGDRRLHHRRAADLWGLAAADVVANVTFHEPDRDGGDRNLLARYRDSLGLRVFDAFGGYDVRRARVAERDGDLPLALARWAAWKPQNAADREERDMALARLAQRLFNLPDPYGPRANLEATIEQLRRDASSPGALGKSLRSVESALDDIHQKERSPVLDHLLFRLRSFSRDAAHRRADLDEARRLDDAQRHARARVAAEPEGFPLVLDDDARAVNLLTQTLDLTAALDAARSYHRLVAQYAEVWDLLDDSGRDGFRASRVHLRAAQTLARHLAFASALNSDVSLHQAQEILDALPPPHAPDDRSRLRNDRVLVALRANRVEDALALAALSDEPNAYDVYYACRAASSALLADPHAHRAEAQALYDAARAAHPVWLPAHSPLPLTWRERALLAHLLGDRSDARHALGEAATRTGNLPGDAPIKRWLSLVIGVYRDRIEGRGNRPSTHAEVHTGEDAHHALVARADSLASVPGGSALMAVRAVTPY